MLLYKCYLFVYLYFMKNDLNKGEVYLSLDMQRELLLDLNPDIIYWVYGLRPSFNDEIDLELIEDVMTIYPNQLENIKWIEQASGIRLIDLWALRKWEFKLLSSNDKPDYTRWKWFNSTWWYKTEVDNWFNGLRLNWKAVLLSNWVLEYIEWTTWKKHLITTLRDWWSFDNLQRTTTAWRNVWYNLWKEVEREHFEEWPYLWKNKNWEYVLCIPEWNDKWEEYTRKSIKFWLENKFNLSREDEEDLKMIKIFERNFPWIKYEELWSILIDISENNRFLKYSWDNEEIPELSDDMKKINITNLWQKNSINAFVYFDKANNTIEYREVRRITNFPEEFVPLSKRPWKIFLESQNQYSRVPRLENAHKNSPVPTIEYVSKKVENLIQKKD